MIGKAKKSTGSLPSERFGPTLPPKVLAGFVTAALAVFLTAYFSFISLQDRSAANREVTRSLDALAAIQATSAAVTDAETGLRGYLLIRDESFLRPFAEARAALPGVIERLQSLIEGDHAQQERLRQASVAIQERLSDLQGSIDAKGRGDMQAALDVVTNDQSKAVSERVRTLLRALEARESDRLAVRQDIWREAARVSFLIVLGGSGLLIALVLIAATVTAKDVRAKAKQAWLKAGLAGLSARLQGDQRLETLSEHALGFLADYLGAQVGCLYLSEGGSQFRLCGGYALPAEFQVEQHSLRISDGLLGRAAKENRILHVPDVPPDYLPISSALGRTKPAHVLIAPASVYGVVQAVIELGFLHGGDESDIELLRDISEPLAVAVRAARDRTRLEELLEETQRQAEEMQAQQEELRVSNEELEEQACALKDSQARLESQQSELEQSNHQLAQQTLLFQSQRDALAAAQEGLLQKAAELEQANSYKSEFLANMSHELRTPLNSTLILARLLADNDSGNLNADQVKYAETICSAGKDLLTLINDILDLAKIEAGKIDLQPNAVDVDQFITGLSEMFVPQAERKRLTLLCLRDVDAPASIITDEQRLAQILRNLLANAIKFTEQGSVSLRVRRGHGDSLEFAVQDTGIGIPEHQQQVVFEAFRQADGSIHRRYGGTGLGLSIARNLAGTLGGRLQMHSTFGAGSTFTLTLPVEYVPDQAAASYPSAMPIEVQPPVPAPAPSQSTPLPSVKAGARNLLVVEDDMRFAAILRDLAEELGFVPVVVHTAQDGARAARQSGISAIVLDMHLPDRSGLSLLEELKRDPATRHLPIHMVSVADHSQEALSRGAVGYALKPIRREELVIALRKLESKLAQQVRYVLVVEDNPAQMESIRSLLCAEGVEIVGVGTAAQALEQLSQKTYDCMVLDLSLPDLSGFELLERMASNETVAFPPVIVYTARMLTQEEEQQLRRFSRSIIVKDARSPERLLDEVTLFLHQVETTLPPERQRMLRDARDRESAFEGRCILVVEDDVRNIFALSKVLEPKGAKVEIARNGREALEALERSRLSTIPIDLVLMDIMMPEMDGLTAMREIRQSPEWKKLPMIALTAKAMKDDQERCLQAGANDYIAKPLDVEKLLSLLRVWMPR